MKKIMFVFLFLSIFESLWSQKRENLSIGFHRFFMSTDNLAIFYSKQTNKNEWGVGLKYHFNKGIWERGHINQRNMYSSDIKQNFGLMAEYRKYFFDKSYKWVSIFRPYFVFHTAVSYKDVQAMTYGYNLVENYFEYFLVKDGPVLVIDNNIGVGCRFFQDKKVSGYLQVGGGRGFAFVVPSPDQYTRNFDEWTYMLNVGLTYNLRDTTPQKKAKK